jgi:hypothetical protein
MKHSSFHTTFLYSVLIFKIFVQAGTIFLQMVYHLNRAFELKCSNLISSTHPIWAVIFLINAKISSQKGKVINSMYIFCWSYCYHFCMMLFLDLRYYLRGIFQLLFCVSGKNFSLHSHFIHNLIFDNEWLRSSFWLNHL